MKYRILLVIILLLFVEAGWSADQKDKKGDEKGQAMLPNPAEGIVYALPRTVLSVKIKLIKESFKAGPYALFADKYLGYQGAKTINSEKWTITGMEVTCLGEADPDAVFKTSGVSATLVSLYPDGSIAGINSRSAIDPNIGFGNNNIVFSTIPDIIFPDQSSDDQYDIEVNSATGEEKVKFKTVEDKAREAADYLFRLRKKRAYTILSPSDGVPEDGKAFEVFVGQAEKIEKEYVALFLGKTYTSEQEFTLNYIPGQESIKNDMLFRFSDEKGILPKSDISGKPVTIDLVKEQKQFSSIESIYQSIGPNVSRSGLFYRIPVNASLTIAEGFNILYNGRFPVAQFGLISPIPELLINDNTSITFDRKTGAISNCEKNK